jgi:deoxycytidine triphosphate deaminase
MFINPKTAIEKGWIKGNIQEKNIQPNAIDFTVDTLHGVNSSDPFILSETGKKMRKTNEMVAEELVHSSFAPGINGWWLQRDNLYDAMSDLIVDLPEGIAALLVARSTLTRNGLFVTSGLYDSGFKGHIGVVIHNRSGEAFLEKGVRIGQIIFVASENAGVYAGGYNHEQGTHWTEDKK